MSERQIREVVRQGACTVGAIARRTRAGTNCGACACDLKQVLFDEVRRNEAETLPLAAK